MIPGGITRRGALRAGAGVTAAALATRYATSLNAAAAAGLRTPDSVADPRRAVGEPDAAMPFDHIVVVMQENHSFDSYLGMLPHVDGFDLDGAGRPLNANPYKDGYITVQRAASLCQPGGPSQTWKATHQQVDGGRMDGFATQAPATMLYWDETQLPFYASLAKTFCTGDRWFSSAPCQTYPNRRFMLAGTAFGLISTDTSSVTQDPPNGTIFDRLDAAGITWKDYFTDVPATGVIASVPMKHPQNLAPIDAFYTDCAAGTLPAVSFVDSDIGIAAVVSDATLGQVDAPFTQTADAQNEDEENPADESLGENFVSRAVNAVLRSPLWPRVLLVWTYDEHGGYYDHVPPPAAIPPDAIAPRLGAGDPPGGYDVYGVRVPSVVVSGHALRGGVTSVVHDHTSILATIERKWNLPSLTHRDANAATLMDFLDTSRVTFPEPPAVAAPSDVAASEQSCSTAEPSFTVHHGASPAAVLSPGGLVVRFYGRRHREHGVVVALQMRSGTAKNLIVELERRGHVVARAHAAHVGTARHMLTLHRHHFASGHYTLRVRHGRHTIVRRRVRLR